MDSVRKIIPFLFLPAGLGLLAKIIQPRSVAECLLAMAFTLFCIELAKMAQVDFDNVVLVTQKQTEHQPEATQSEALQPSDGRLKRFLIVLSSTVVLELVGFYIASFSLPTGAMVIIFSQLWFNLLAGVQLCPQTEPVIIELDIRDRLPVLISNFLALVLIFGWFIEDFQIWVATGLLALTVLYLVVKYFLTGNRPTSLSQQSEQ